MVRDGRYILFTRFTLPQTPCAFAPNTNASMLEPVLEQLDFSVSQNEIKKNMHGRIECNLQRWRCCLCSSALLHAKPNSERKATEPMYRTSINYVIFCDVNEYCILSYSLLLCVWARPKKWIRMQYYILSTRSESAMSFILYPYLHRNTNIIIFIPGEWRLMFTSAAFRNFHFLCRQFAISSGQSCIMHFICVYREPPAKSANKLKST